MEKYKNNKIMKFLALTVLIINSVISVQAAGSVTLSAVPTSNTVTVGQSADYTIKIIRDGFTGKVTLSATGLPAGATATFNPNSTTAASSVLTVKTATSTPVGTFDITVKGTASGITIAPIIVRLITKAQSSVSVTINPDTQSIIAGQQTYYDIQIIRTNYDGLVNLTAENLPDGVTVKFEPSSTYGNSSRMYLYSHRLPFFPYDYSLLMRANGVGDVVGSLKVFHLVVNCGIVWADQFGTPDNNTGNPEFATDITYDLDSMGNVNNTYVVGYTNKLGENDFDSWVAKFDRNGNRLWLTMINLSLREEFAKKVSVDSAGNVYVGGYFRTSDNFVNYDGFLARFTPNGVRSGLNIVGTFYEDGAGGMVIGFNAGNVIFTLPTDVRRVGVANYDLRRYVFNSSFNPTSDTILANDVTGDPKDLAIAPDGSMYIVGETQEFSTVYGIIEKFNATGSSVWRERYNINDVRPKKVIVDGNNNAYVATESRFRNNNYYVEVRKYFSNHIANNPPAWIYQESSTDEYKINAIAVDNNNHVYFGGSKGLSNRNGWFTKIGTVTGNSILKREFLVADKDSFNAFKANDSNELFIAGDTVNFKNVNFGYEDALVLRYATNFCLF